jgi:PAS domain S-box-containing protein
MSRFFFSIRFRLILLVLLAVIPALGLTFYTGIEQRRIASAQAKEEALRLARLVSSNQSQLIEGARHFLYMLAQLSPVRNCDSASCCSLFADLLKQYPWYLNIGAAEPNGNIFASAIPFTQSVNIADRSYFRRALQSRNFGIGEYQIGRIVGKPVVNFGYPVIDEMGELRAVVYVALDLTWLNQLAVQVELPTGSTLTVVDGKGTILARHPVSDKWVGKTLPEASIIKTALVQGEGMTEATGVDGIPRLYAFTSFGKRTEQAGNIYVTVGIPISVAFAQVDRILTRNLKFLGFIALLTLAAAWIGGYLLLLRRLNPILTATKRLGAGDLSARTGVAYARGELSQLALSFDKMADSLEQRESERKQAEQLLDTEKKRFQTLSDNAPFGMVMIDKDGTFRYINPKFRELFSYDLDDVPNGKTWFRKAYPDTAYRHNVISTWINDLESLRPGEKRSRIFTVTCKDGTQKIVDFIPVQLETGENMMTCEDITELAQAEKENAALEEQFRQSQKMEAIGQLAGGVAHDFNNLLTVIKGYSQLSLVEPKEGDSFKTDVEEIQKAADRATDLIRKLLAFSRRQVMEMRVIDLNALITDLDKMLRRVIGEDIELVTVIAEDLGRVKVDPGQIEQVIMNLAVNARDAMPKGGKLSIETANVELDEAYGRSHAAVKPGRYVMLSVTDTGVGMTQEVKERVFEPFFTIKEKGKGTGLGLSTVYGIVKQSGGNIWVYSEVGKGTTFKIYLPRVDEAPDERKEKAVAEELPRGNETILLVEDEEDVRKLAVRVLERQGYKVLEAAQGSDALLICEQHEGPTHLMVTDMVMPGMSGRELAENLSSLHPEIKVLYMSGYTDNTIAHHGILEPGLNYIQKPFSVEGLIRKVREALDK